MQQVFTLLMAGSIIALSITPMVGKWTVQSKNDLRSIHRHSRCAIVCYVP